MKFRFKDKIFFALLAIGIVFIVYGKITDSDENNNSADQTMKAQIGGNEIILEVPKTIEARGKGLGQRDSIEENRGMVFEFESVARHAFVMTGMKFSLDFIFVRGDEIVDIAQNVPADFGGKIIGGVDYDKVIELNSGWTEKRGIQIGDKVIFN